MVFLFGLWAVLMIVGFGLIQWALADRSEPSGTLPSRLMMSGDAFFTLGYGDVVPHTAAARALVFVEAGAGFGLIALTLSYLPVLYQHFARRDAQLIQLAPRAGSPVSGAVLLLQRAAEAGSSSLDAWLREWEIWAGDVLESQASYPMLAFYRSQHRHHSWLASLALILDCCALLIAFAKTAPALQASAACTTARRVVHEACNALGVHDLPTDRADRIPPREHLVNLGRSLEKTGLGWSHDPEGEAVLGALRATYEPALIALSAYLLLPLPPWPVDDAPLTSRERIIRNLLG